MHAPRPRLLQVIVLGAVIVAGVVGYRKVVRPDKRLLARFAEQELQRVFGPGVTSVSMTVDLVEGVEIRGLAVRTPQTDQPTLEADVVRVRHDVIALASGTYKPLEIVIEEARIVTHETEAGIAPDFPFDLGEREGGDVPRLDVRNATLFYRAMPASPRLREKFVLKLTDVDLLVAPMPAGTLSVRGGFRTQGLGQDDVRIEVNGWADTSGDRLAVEILWSPFVVSEYLVERVLAEEIASKLRGRPFEKGKLTVALRRGPEETAGELRVSATWEGDVRMDVGEIPGAERIDARTREQLQALFSTGTLKFQVSERGIDIEGLAAAVGGGEVTASGRVEDDGEVMHLLVKVRGLRIEDPSIRKALGAQGTEIFDEFAATGRVNADVRITKERDQPVDFEVNAILDDLTFRYVGAPMPEGGRDGFPYPVVNATGTVRIVPGRVDVGGITGVGARSPAFFTLRGSHEQAWTGGETGRILLTDAGADIRLTVVGENVPVDADLIAAVKGSDFADILEHYKLGGSIERLEIDVFREPGRDRAAITEIRITLGGTTFRYTDFPLPFDDVHGTVTMRRPILESGKRGKVFAFQVDGTIGGAKARTSAEFVEHEDRGRLRIEATDIALEGALHDAVLASEGLEDTLGAAWRFLGPRGRADLKGDLALEQDPDPSSIDIALRDASIRLDASRAEEAIEVAGITGTVSVRGDNVSIGQSADRPEGWITGSIEGTPVRLRGRLDGGATGRWDVEVATEVIHLSERLRAEIARLAGAASILPEGYTLGDDARLALRLRVRREPGEESPIQVDATAESLAAQITLPSGLSFAVEGQKMSVEGSTVRLRDVTATIPGGRIVVHEGVIGPEGITGSFEVFLDRFEATTDFLSLLPADVREDLEPYLAGRLLTTERLLVVTPPEGGVFLQGELLFVSREGSPANKAPLGQVWLEPLVISPDRPEGRTIRGVVRVRDFTFDPGVPLDEVAGTLRIERLRLGDDPEGTATIESLSGRLWVLDLEDVNIPLVWKDGILTAKTIRGTIARGRLGGHLVFHTREPTAYEGHLEVDRFDLRTLREDLAPSGPPLAGIGNARVTFQNRSGRLQDLTASGGVSIREGNLGDLPPVATIFALVDAVLPVDCPPKFEKADATFILRNEVVEICCIRLAGPLFEMEGKGTLDLTGYLDVTFKPQFIKSLLFPGVMQLPVVGGLLSGQLLKRFTALFGLPGLAADILSQEQFLYAVRIRGDLDNAEPEIVVLPILGGLGGGGGNEFEGTGTPQPPPRRIPRWFR